MKDRILELLRQESGYLSGQEMSTLLGVSRAANEVPPRQHMGDGRSLNR